jgi:multiple sugar transport system substrate-binding protein
MKQSRILLLVLLCMLFVASFAQAQDEEVTLRWRTRTSNQGEIDVYTAASAAIDESWDGVTLVYEPGSQQGSAYQDVLISELEAGTAPEVFWIPGTDVARFAEAGLIWNLADLAAADANFDPEAFYAGPMGFLTTSPVEGSDALWGLPRDVSAFAIYYNADLFDEAGLDYPASGWTWDEFVADAEALSGLGSEIVGFGMSSWWANWGYFVNAAGSSLFNEDYTACGLNNEDTVQGLETAASLYENNWAVSWLTEPETPFLAGNVGMLMNGRWSTPGILDAATFNWNVAPLPVGPSGEATNYLFWGAYVVNGTLDEDTAALAWDLLTRLTSADIQGQIASLGANIPSRQTQDAIDLFLATLPDTEINNMAFVEGTTAADVRTEAPLFFGDWPAIDQAYGSAVNEVFSGNLTAQEFADTICDQVDQYFEQ